jgi:hypothetical protein
LSPPQDSGAGRQHRAANAPAQTEDRLKRFGAPSTDETAKSDDFPAMNTKQHIADERDAFEVSPSRTTGPRTGSAIARSV